MRDGEKPVAAGDGKERKCLLVALLRAGHELGSIPSSQMEPDWTCSHKGMTARGAFRLNLRRSKLRTGREDEGLSVKD